MRIVLLRLVRVALTACTVSVRHTPLPQKKRKKEKKSANLRNNLNKHKHKKRERDGGSGQTDGQKLCTIQLVRFKGCTAEVDFFVPTLPSFQPPQKKKKGPVLI